MHYTPRRQRELRIANAVFVLLFLVAIGLLQWLSREYSMRFDLTGTGRHSLSDASIAAAERLQGPVKITAYASKRGDTRGRIQGLVSRYQQHKPDLDLIFIDPDESPDKVRAAGVRMLATLAEGRAPGSESSLEKITWSEFDKRFRETALDLLGPGGQLLRAAPGARSEVDWAREYLWSRAGTIYSGSSEIQRNIIAKRVLGLPQDGR